MSTYARSCIRLHIIKTCFCCFLDMPLYSDKLSSITKISSLILLELFPACFSCNYNFNLLQSSSRSDDKSFVFETPEAETIKPGELSNFLRALSREDFYLELLNQNAFLLQSHIIVFYPLN